MLLINSQGHVLVVNRKSGEGVCMPGGKLEDGEDFLQAAIRETREETGLQLHPSLLFMIHRGICTAEDGRTFDTATYLADQWEGTLGGEEPDMQPRWGHWGELIENSPFNDYNWLMARDGFLPHLQKHSQWTPKLEAWMQAFTDHVNLHQQATRS